VQSVPLASGSVSEVSLLGWMTKACMVAGRDVIVDVELSLVLVIVNVVGCYFVCRLFL
jgi:hypothetical protein